MYISWISRKKNLKISKPHFLKYIYVLKTIICNGALTGTVKALNFLRRFQSWNGNSAQIVFFYFLFFIFVFHVIQTLSNIFHNPKWEKITNQERKKKSNLLATTTGKRRLRRPFPDSGGFSSWRAGVDTAVFQSGFLILRFFFLFSERL